MGRRDRDRRDDRRNLTPPAPAQPARVAASRPQPMQTNSRIISSMLRPTPPVARQPATSRPMAKAVTVESATPRALPPSVLDRRLERQNAMRVRTLSTDLQVKRQDEKPSRTVSRLESETLQRKGVAAAPARPSSDALKLDEGGSCRAANRPKSNSGDGSSRPFVPWCQTGRSKK